LSNAEAHRASLCVTVLRLQWQPGRVEPHDSNRLRTGNPLKGAGEEPGRSGSPAIGENFEIKKAVARSIATVA
jgi:hypothetical protein